MSLAQENTELYNEQNSSSEFFINLFSRGSNFKKRLEMYHSTTICKAISAALNVKDHHIKDLPMTYRTINHWESLGLIDCDRKEGTEWREFSIMDQLWLYTIEALREFGLSLDRVKNAKNIFFSPIGNYAFSIMEYYTSCAYILLEHVFLIVFSDGFAIPLTYSEYQNALKSNWIRNHVQISVNEIIQKIFQDPLLVPRYKNEALITPQEFEVLHMMRTGDFEEVKIRLNNGSIYLLEGIEDLTGMTKIEDIIRKGNYQDLEVKQENGSVVSVKRTLKKLIE
jgi:MerR HTH family regulatory protein